MTTAPVGTIMVPGSGRGGSGNGGGGEVERHGFGTNETHRTGETASTAMAAQATAQMQARYVMALKKPRDLMIVRAALLKDCGRPGFADAAIYHKPIGDGIEGPSIRMAEAAARAMTNIHSSVIAIYDDPKKRIIRVSATDLESNVTYDKDVTVPKTMERSNLKKGQTPLKVRFNSKEKPVYLVDAETDDDILNTENALASKALRVCILRLIPGDILDEAIREAQYTLNKKVTDDPDKALKSVCDGFEMDLGITPVQLAEYLGHPVSQSTAQEISLLGKLLVTLKEGETSWAEVMENRGQAAPEPHTAGGESAQGATAPAAGAPAAATTPKGHADLSQVAAATRAKREGRQGGNTPPPTTNQGPPSVSADDDDRRGDDPMLDGQPGHPRRR